MKVRYEYLTDSTFLKMLDTQKLQEQFAKITVLDWQENPIQEIQGIVTGGNLNLDGQSSMRRTCNLSIFVNENEYASITNVDNIISINKKIYIEIGRTNTTEYYQNHSIIWYPQGVFVVINPAISHGTDGVNISLQCKDKMCLLNGDCGGTIPASTQFDQYDTIDEDGKWITTKPPIHQVIREIVNHFGGEQLGKIIISDIPDRIKQVMKWIGTTPLYLTKDGENYTMSTNIKDASKGTKTYYYGDDVGYIYADFVLTNEVIGDAGSTVTAILDRIKEMLGNYEYYYDVDGNFIFQEIKNYLNTSQATVELESLSNKDYKIDISSGKTIYNFDNSVLITSYSNTPQFNMIKNDFIVWGIRKNANGNDVPIRYHLAIDSKPKWGNTYDCFYYEDPDDGLTKAKLPIKFKDFNTLKKNAGAAGNFYMTEDDGNIYVWDGEHHQYNIVYIALDKITTKDWRTELYLQGVQSEPFGTKSNYYYTELINEWPKLYDLKNQKFYDEYINTPSDMDYYLDFIDSSAEISKFSISNIGRRTKVINDNSVNCIFAPEIPELIIIELGQEDTYEKRKECIAKNQNFIQVTSNIFNMLAIGGQSNSAYETIRTLLHQYTSYNESISIQALPIYYLEPNTRIGVRDLESDIYGDYMISTISIPLGIEGTMSIAATRALERI